MIGFYSTILKAIADYKAILRKTLPANVRATKMYELGIKKKYTNSDEVELYKVGLKIVEELKSYVADCENKGRKTVNFYLGAKEFLQYLEGFLSKYNIEDGKLLHVGQKVSCALIDLVQMIKFSRENLEEQDATKIKRYIDVVASYGSKEQKKMLVEAVSSYQLDLTKYFPQGFSIRLS